MAPIRVAWWRSSSPGGRRLPQPVGARPAQSTVELALTAPLLLLLLGGVVDLGRAMYYREAVANAARQAVQAATYGDTSTGTPAHSTNAAGLRACQLAGGAQASLTRNVPDSTGDAIATIVNEAALESSSDGTPAGSILNNGTGGGATTMTITWNCNVVGVEPVTDAGAASTDPGTTSSAAVKARVVYRYSPVTTLFNRLFSAPISIVSTALGYNQF